MRRCYTCGRTPMVHSEGRFADGSWADDHKLPREAQGEWFCSYACYRKALNQGRRTASESKSGERGER
jgi:hypothetical protein